MTLYLLSKLPFKERYNFVYEKNENNIALTFDEILVKEIFEDTIDWFMNPPKIQEPNIINILQNPNSLLPSIFETIYGIKEKARIENLPSNERKRIFEESKEAWRINYPDFNTISEIMLKFGSDEMLLEFQRHSPPSFIREKASELYKKCLSYKVKLKNHKIDSLGYSYTPGPWCINHVKVQKFTDEYGDWGRKASNLWNKIYSLKDRYYSIYCYEDWKRYTQNSSVLKEKTIEFQKLLDDTILLLNNGIEMISKHDEEITLEYSINSTEMSYYERELEILQFNEGENDRDEEYCYVYTLECELFVFYVGIAANPNERFEQHKRGAYSNEAHLFKSKFIQKYHSQVIQKIIYEGTRRECRKIEKDYIAEFNPLGNMTIGGEG